MLLQPRYSTYGPGLDADDARLHVLDVDSVPCDAAGTGAAGRRLMRHAIRYEMKLRTGRSPLPACLMHGVVDQRDGGASASTGPFEGWVGGVDDLDALVAAGPGRLAARLMEAAWLFEKRKGLSTDA